MELRQKILDAAVRVFAEGGYRGATTRRIAQEAGVNEVTLFRHFGSKDDLLSEAIRCAGRDEPGDLASLPETPVDPERELTEWCTAHYTHLRNVSGFIRVCMAAQEEHPEIGQIASERPTRVAETLGRYLKRLQTEGLASPTADVAAATAMLMHCIFGDAVSRDIHADLYSFSSEEAPVRYVKLLLSAIGARRP